jgi:peptide/nickel transport system permease protein
MMLDSLRSWAWFLVRRLGYLAVSLVVVSMITFGATRLLGNPAYLLVGTTHTKEMLENTIKELGLDRPVHEQYARHQQAARGDLGTSRYTFNPVTEDIVGGCPRHWSLITYSLLIGAPWAVPAGLLAGRYKTALRPIESGTARAGASVPNLVRPAPYSGFFATLHWPPPPLGCIGAGVAPVVTGWYTIDSLLAGNLQAFWASLKQLAMPALTLAFTTSPSLFQITRNSTESVYGTDYMRTAKAFGLSTATVTRYALKNILVPVLTMLAMTYGYLFGGTVLVEVVFACPVWAVRGRCHEPRRLRADHRRRTAEYDLLYPRLHPGRYNQQRDRSAHTYGNTMSVETVPVLGRPSAYRRLVTAHGARRVNLTVGLLAFIVALGLVAPLLPLKNPINPDPFNSLQPPSAEYWFGTDPTASTCSRARFTPSAPTSRWPLARW